MNLVPSAPLSATSAHPPSRVRAWLVLSRGSNLPTVWSNCLAGWWLGGGRFSDPGAAARVAWLLLGASLLYTAGMWFNDAYDSIWDAAHRPERPIPAGTVPRRDVVRAGIVAILLGWACLWPLGLRTVLWALVLTACVETYNRVHKCWAHASWLMAACRFCLYPLGASVAGRNFGNVLICADGLILALYVAGITYLARTESLPESKALRWPWLLLEAPIAAWFLTNLGPASPLSLVVWLTFVPLAAWLAYVQHTAVRGRPPVAQLLAGIALVDLTLVHSQTLDRSLAFGCLFVTARLFQRWVPAT